MEESESRNVQDALVQALKHSDGERRIERTARIRWASQYDIPAAVIFGPVEAMNLVREARECFVDGHFIATLMLATALIEHVISEELVYAGKAKYGMSFASAIELARKDGLFPGELLNTADNLRALRNPFAHRKPDDHQYTLGNRYLAEKRHPQLLLEEDAKASLVVMYACFRHTLRSA